MATADAVLRKLRKVEANMICPNCETKAQQGVGFGNVCVKFKTFVCDLCKTSHQAISHRVKSITMSNWTMEEVNELMDKNGGGNAAALHIWLQKAPRCGQRYAGGVRPKEGDRIENFKQFVLDAYELGKFKADTPYQPTAGGTNSNSVSVDSTPMGSKSSSPVPALRREISSGSARSTNSAYSADLVDFHHSDSAAGQQANRSSRAATLPPRVPSFDAFTKPSASSAAASDPFASSAAVDPFGLDAPQAPPRQQQQTLQQRIQKPSAAPPAAPPAVSLLDFSEPLPPAAPQQHHQQLSTSSVQSASTENNAWEGFGEFSGFDSPMNPSSGNQSPVPKQAPPPQQQPATTNSFDPFGANLLTPMNTMNQGNSGLNSPSRSQPPPQQPQRAMPQNFSNPNMQTMMGGNNATANSWSSHSPSPNLYQQPQQSSSGKNNMVDMFSGLTFDSASSSNKSNPPSSMMMGGGNNSNNIYNNPQQGNWAKPSPMMQSANAISQIDVFARANQNNNSSYGNGGSNPGSNRYGGTAPMGRAMQPPYQQQPSAQQQRQAQGGGGGGSFDFLQDTMRQQLNNSQSQTKPYR